jgi:hypothetical protein
MSCARRLWLPLLVLLSGLGGPRVLPALGGPAGAHATPEPSAAAAEAWLLGLRAASAARMEKVVGFPLRIATGDGQGACDGQVPNLAKLPAALKCLRSEERLLYRALQQGDALGPFQAVELREIASPELRSLVEGQPGRARATLVRVELNAVGISYELVFVVDTAGPTPLVRAFFFDAIVAA